MYEPKNLELWGLYGAGTITKEFLSLERFSYPLRLVGVHNKAFAHLLSTDFLVIMITKTKLIPHAQEVLDELRAHAYHLTIVSNGFRDVQYDKLRNSGLLHYFDTIVLSQEVGFMKPDPRFFEHALEKSAANANQVLMVGDNYEVDIVGARQARIQEHERKQQNNPKRCNLQRICHAQGWVLNWLNGLLLFTGLFIHIAYSLFGVVVDGSCYIARLQVCEHTYFSRNATLRLFGCIHRKPVFHSIYPQPADDKPKRMTSTVMRNQ